MAMGVYVLSFLIVSFCLLLQRGLCEGAREKQEHALYPPRGWNSYDAFDWIISEEEFLQNAEILSKRLLPYGYEYAVVDYLWYRRKVKGAYPDSLGFDVIDEWGRLIPDPGRWPSSKDGNGFKEVAKKVHDMGLKFGIHTMRGISTQAVNANTPILDPDKGGPFNESGRIWQAKDIGLKERACAWMPHGFMSVNTDLPAGRAFLKSLYRQYAEWGVDFVKNDCVFGDDLDIIEISTISQVLKELDRPILFSLSPGTSVMPAMAKDVYSLVNMYRITGDDWDKWGDVRYHFNVARDFAAAHLIGAEGLKGKSWPDMDMLPLGWITDPGTRLQYKWHEFHEYVMSNHSSTFGAQNIGKYSSSSKGPHRECSLALDEQKTQITLWSMAKSPLMYGGDLRNIDETTFKLITNPTILEIDYFSHNNMEVSELISTKDLSSSSNRISCSSSNRISCPSRILKDENSSGKHVLSLTSCKDLKAKGWVIRIHEEDLGQICWKDSLRSKEQQPFCLHKRQPLLTSDEESIYKLQYQGKFHLQRMNTMEFCLEASTNRKFTSQELRKSSLAPCKWHANQMWELNHNGTLVSSYSGLCATMETMKGTVDDAEARAWIATGRKGEIYVAFFNLSSEKMLISAKIEDFAKVLNLRFSRCKGTEIWSGEDIEPADMILSATTASHGCALFVLDCN